MSFSTRTCSIAGFVGSLILAVAIVRPAPAHAQAAPCTIIAFTEQTTVPRGAFAPVDVFAACPDAPIITAGLVVNGTAMNLTLAESTPGPLAFDRFLVPTRILPPGTYTFTVYVNGQYAPMHPAPLTVTSGP